MNKIISLIAISISLTSFSQIDGEWHTSFSIMGMTERMDMTISNYPSEPMITITDPDKASIKEVKMDKVVVTDSSLSFTWAKIGLSYKGVYFKNGDSIQGVMSQMDLKWGATFTRQIQEKIIIKRPQTPISFAYPVEEITIQNGDIQLGATLTLPKNAGNKYPIVVLASGSGAQDRDCEILGHKSFLVISDYLARNGIGCLRFDDRGVGKSTGSYQKASLQDFGSDVRACVSYLSKDPRFEGHPIGIAGHSEGGMHALIAAKKNKKVAFIVELASVGTSGRDVLVEQQYLVPKKSGKSEEYAKWNQEVYAGICDIIANYNQEKAAEPITVFLDKMYEKAPQEYKDQSNIFNFKIGLNMLLNNDWGRQFIAFETKDYLSKLKIPVLAINGSQDLQVPPISNQSGFAKNFSKKSQLKSKAIVVDGLNHLFQRCNTCTVYEYGELEETFSEDVLKLMTNWIKEVNP